MLRVFKVKTCVRLCCAGSHEKQQAGTYQRYPCGVPLHDMTTKASASRAKGNLVALSIDASVRAALKEIGAHQGLHDAAPRNALAHQHRLRHQAH